MRNKLVVFILILLPFLYPLCVQGAAHDHEDKLILYVFKKIDEYDSFEQLPWLAPFLIELGHYRGLLNRFHRIRDSHGLSLLVSEMLNGVIDLTVKDIDKIRSSVYSLEDRALRWSFKKSLLFFYLNKHDIDRVKILFSGLNREITQELKKKSFTVDIYSLVDLIEPLVRLDLELEANIVMDQCKRFVRENGDLILLRRLLEVEGALNINLGLGEILEDLQKHFILDKDIYSRRAEELFLFAKILFGLKEYETANDFFIMAIKAGVKNGPDALLSQFLNESSMDGVAQFLGKNPKICNLLKDGIVYNKRTNHFEKAYIEQEFNKSIVRFFIEVGKIDEAASLSKKLDSLTRQNFYTDYFIYCLGEKSTQSPFYYCIAPMLLEELEDESIKIDFIITYAWSFNRNAAPNSKSGIGDSYSRIIKQTEGYLEILPKGLSHERKAILIAVGWLEGGFPGNAYGLVSRVNNKYVKTLILFEIAQYYIFIDNLKRAVQVIEEIDDLQYAGELYSKIASRLLLKGNKEQALSFYRMSVDMILESKEANLFEFLKDYRNARIYRKVTKTKLLDKVMLLNTQMR